MERKRAENPMRRDGERLAMHDAPLRSADPARLACQQAGMANGRCRMHGGASTGPRTAEGIERLRRLRWKNGFRSGEAIARRAEVAAILRAARTAVSGKQVD